MKVYITVLMDGGMTDIVGVNRSLENALSLVGKIRSDHDNHSENAMKEYEDPMKPFLVWFEGSYIVAIQESWLGE